MSPTVLFQPQNHVGLGHINRLSAIALALRRIDPFVRTPFVVEGSAHVLLDALGLPYAPLPSSHMMHETACWASWDSEEQWQLSVEVSKAVVKSLSPELVVFDCLPKRAFAFIIRKIKIPFT